METLVILLVVIVAGAAVVYFMNSPKGMQVVRKKTVSTILNDMRALQLSTPETALHDIYYALAEERTNKSNWLTESITYTSCGMPGVSIQTAPEPEQFAEMLASVEEKIRLQASGVAGGS